MKLKLIYIRQASRIDGLQAEAILGLEVDKRRAFWLRDGTVYVRTPYWIDAPPETLISYLDDIDCWEHHYHLPQVREMRVKYPGSYWP